MTYAISFPSKVAPRFPRGEVGASSRTGRVRSRSDHATHDAPGALGRYRDWMGRPREVVARGGFAGSVLVLDRDANTLGDRRLVAHLGADEPAENAALVCSLYLQEAPSDRCACRRVTAEDARIAPFEDECEAPSGEASLPSETELDRRGCSYRLELLRTRMSIPELRWCRDSPERAGDEPQPVSVREVIASLESYDPVSTLTRGALALHRGDAEVSTALLRAELARIQQSPIVLNRRLREVALATIEREALSMSEIAIRCGRVKRDCSGNESGETSWLARRLGLLPEGGRDMPTPWIHSDVLALIARCGLGISPREVELE